MVNDCIFALSTGGLPSGVAVVRVSGDYLAKKLHTFIDGKFPEVGRITLRDIIDPSSSGLIDRGLVCLFAAPNSFTGEDCFEFHLHGGRAVVDRLLEALSGLAGFRLAEAGEFSKRAFENGKLDLTEIEGLSDLLAAETEEQRKLAVSQANGALRGKLEGWRTDLVRSRAFIEAELDFADEDDVPGSVSNQVWQNVSDLIEEVEGFLEDGHRGEIVRRGFKIALMGLPNAGKSSLLNALAQRDIAIVSDEAGTTRDVLEVSLNIGGFQAIVYDTAGIRDSQSKVETEGVKRALKVGDDADLVLWLEDVAQVANQSRKPRSSVLVKTKDDDSNVDADELSCSVKRKDGLEDLIAFVGELLSKTLSTGNSAQITRVRHRQELHNTVGHLRDSAVNPNKDISLRSEDLRLAGECLGRITGRIDVEDLLDLIFSEFCIGK